MSNNVFPPIMILGSERSGTNLLRALLSTHSQIASPPPAGFVDALGGMVECYFPEGRPALLTELAGDAILMTKTHLNPWGIDIAVEDVKSRLRQPSFWEVFRAMNEIYADAHGRPCWCSKEPGLFRFIPEIANHLPDAKFVYLSRDGRDVVASMLKGRLHQFHVYFAAQNWGWTQRFCLDALSDPALRDRIFLLKYEELIENPEHSLRDLMQFLGHQFEDTQLKYYDNKNIVDHSRKSRFWRNLARPIDSANKAKYKDSLGAKGIEIFESIAWREMEALGYPLDSQHNKQFTGSDIRWYRAIAEFRRMLWSMDPRAEARRHRARVKATREIMGNAKKRVVLE